MDIKEAQRAVELDPMNPMLNMEMASLCIYSDFFDKAVCHAKVAIRVDPMLSFHYRILGRAYFHLRQYEDSIKMENKALELGQGRGVNPAWIQIYLSMDYSELGRDKEAQDHIKKLLELDPEFSLEGFRNRSPFKNPADLEREIQALRKAGAPEKTPKF
jgi:tetratricopeptide (TPR) repeat protein